MCPLPYPLFPSLPIEEICIKMEHPSAWVPEWLQWTESSCEFTLWAKNKLLLHSTEISGLFLPAAKPCPKWNRTIQKLFAVLIWTKHSLYLLSMKIRLLENKLLMTVLYLKINLEHPGLWKHGIYFMRTWCLKACWSIEVKLLTSMLMERQGAEARGLLDRKASGFHFEYSTPGLITNSKRS